MDEARHLGFILVQRVWQFLASNLPLLAKSGWPNFSGEIFKVKHDRPFFRPYHTSIPHEMRTDRPGMGRRCCGDLVAV